MSLKGVTRCYTRRSHGRTLADRQSLGRSHRSLHVCRILISIHPRLRRIRMSMHPRLCRIRMSMHPRLCRIRMSMRPRLPYSHVDASSVCRCILGVPARAMPAQPLQRKPKIWRAGADAGAAAFHKLLLHLARHGLRGVYAAGPRHCPTRSTVTAQ